MKKVMQLALAGSVCFMMSNQAFASSDDFIVLTETLPVASISCTRNLDFGSLAVLAGNDETTVLIPPDPVPVVDITGSGVFQVGGVSASSARCEYETPNAGLEFVLSGSSGTYVAGTTAVILEDFELTGPSGILNVDVGTDRRVAGSTSPSTLYIGGLLTIPANHTDFGIYTGEVTVTLVDP